MVHVGEAPGKLILCGEHAVVAGHPAIAVALPRMTRVTLRARLGATAVASGIDDPRLLPALCTVVPDTGWGITIESELPVGCGLGSSAALAIATLRAWNAHEVATGGERADFDALHVRAFAIERAFHGNPSGVDHAVSALGGAVRYTRAGGAPRITPLRLHEPLALVVVNTGPPSHTTAELVERVRQRGAEAELAAIGVLVAEVAERLEAAHVDVAHVGALLDRNHALLQGIGVSTPALDAACVTLRRAGAAGAKLAGAGGGGVAFGLCTRDTAATVAAEAAAQGLDVFGVTIHPTAW